MIELEQEVLAEYERLATNLETVYFDAMQSKIQPRLMQKFYS
jgi:hypothetical protein